MTLTGNDRDYLGDAVSSAGDVNGDGYSDVIAGASGDGSGAGRAYVFYGGPSADNVADVTLNGEAHNDFFGLSVASAGDVNGDGYDDVIVGAYHHGGGTGRAYVYYGGAQMDDVADIILTGDPAGPNGGQFGWSVATAGDVNGDGYADIIVGAYGYENNSGRAYVYYGGPSFDNVSDLTLIGETGESFGSEVASAGDINADGYHDVMVGAPEYGAGTGRLVVFFGGPVMDATADAVLTGDAVGRFGAAASSVGDVNGDGYSDLIAGAYDYDNTNGRAFVFYGGPTMDNQPDIVLTGDATDRFFGAAVAGAGDVNGDGHDDWVVGAPFTAVTHAGRAYVYYGGPARDGVADVTLEGESNDDVFGWAVAGAGDVNGDGRKDVVVSARDYGTNFQGRAYVFDFKSTVRTVSVDLDPDVLNLASNGRWVTAYIEASGFNVTSIDVRSIRLGGSIPAELKPATISDHNGNGVADLMVKFNRQAVAALLLPGLNHLQLTGNLVHGAPFAGSADITAVAGASALTMRILSPLGATPVQLAVDGAGPGGLTVRVYDVHGRLVDHWLEPDAGTNRLSWSGRPGGSPVASGLYFIRADSGGRVGVKKTLVAK